MSAASRDKIASECLDRLRGMVALPESNQLTILMVRSLFSLAYAEGEADGFREAVRVRDESSQPEAWK